MPDQSPTSDDAAWVKMQIDMAVQTEKVGTIGGDIRAIRDDLRNVYATKVEVSDLFEDVKALKANVSWLVKLIFGAVIMAILSLVLVKGGVIH